MRMHFLQGHFLQDLRFGCFFVVSYHSKHADIIVIYEESSLRGQICMLPLLLDNLSKSFREKYTVLRWLQLSSHVNWKAAHIDMQGISKW